MVGVETLSIVFVTISESVKLAFVTMALMVVGSVTLNGAVYNVPSVDDGSVVPSVVK